MNSYQQIGTESLVQRAYDVRHTHVVKPLILTCTVLVYRSLYRQYAILKIFSRGNEFLALYMRWSPALGRKLSPENILKTSGAYFKSTRREIIIPKGNFIGEMFHQQIFFARLCCSFHLNSLIGIVWTFHTNKSKFIYLFIYFLE